MIPQYGELNRIYSDFIVSHTFSFDKQKFITNFYKQYNDTKVFEAAILELVLDKQKEQYTLILDSLRAEIEKNMMLYEKYPLLDDEIISRVCYHFADRYNIDIEEQLEVTQRLNKPLNEAYNRYDSIGYREHTAEEEKQAEIEEATPWIYQLACCMYHDFPCRWIGRRLLPCSTQYRIWVYWGTGLLHGSFCSDRNCLQYCAQ